MGRERTNPFRNFFIYNPANDTSTCTIGNCQRVMAGQHAANLERHVRYVHPEEIDLATQRDAQARNDAGPPPDYGEPSGKKPRLAAGGRHAAVDPGAVKKPKCIPVKITAEQIRDACTELVTANGRPFSLMDDTGFRKLVDPLLDGLRGSLAVDADSVRENVSTAAAAARDLVRAELRDALVCLRLDAASRLGRSVLAIGVQLVRDGALALRTLAAREVAGGEDLAAVVVGVLRDYAVDVSNVYSVTTGGDATKTLLVAPGRQGSAEGRYDDGEPAGDSGSEDATAESLELAELRLQEMSGGAHSLMRGVRCAAHALQLAVGDALDDAPAARLVSDARRVCRRLATQPVAASLREWNLRAPAVDRPARWHSTYGMLEGLLDLEGFCEREAASVPELALSHGAWERLRDLLVALKPARAAAESFRSGRLTIGDFYGAWLKCHLDTASVGSEFSHPLACAMKRREKQLLGNDAVVAAVYMDPRYGVLLTDGESERAQRHLRRAWAAMGPRGGRASSDTPDERSPEDPGAAGTYGGECDELERLLRAKESGSHRKPGGRPGADDGADDVAAALQALDGEPRLKKDANVLVHWEGWRYSKPELFRLSQVALAVPVAHASVERAVSALDFILSPNRCDLDSQTLDDILMVRLNEVFGR